jgi:hypothetical protein
MQTEIYVGRYIWNMIGISIVERDGELQGIVEGAPPGYEIGLTPQGEHTFIMLGGLAHNESLTFVFDKRGKLTGAQVMGLDFERVSDDVSQLANIPPIYHRLPPLELTPAKTAAFEHLAAAIEGGTGGIIEYDLPYPKTEFVRYLQTHHKVLFHGSNNRSIARFEPIRKSWEVSDASGHGNQAAIYATNNGVWAMFFAVIHREKLQGSINNGMLDFYDRAGNLEELYFFTMDVRNANNNPWTDGMLYILPGETFSQTFLPNGMPLPEWVSHVPVTPLAKLAVAPDDFPFLAVAGYHESGIADETMKLLDDLIAETRTWEAVDDGVRVVWDWHAETYQKLSRFIPLGRKVMPAATLELRFEPKGGDFSLSITEPNPVLINILKEKLNKKHSNG